MSRKYKIAAVYCDAGHEIDVEITFMVLSGSGDGWNEPITAAIPEFDSVTGDNGGGLGDHREAVEKWADAYLSGEGYDAAMTEVAEQAAIDLDYRDELRAERLDA